MDWSPHSGAGSHREPEVECVCGKRCARISTLAQHQAVCPKFQAEKSHPGGSAHPPLGKRPSSDAPESQHDALLKLARYRTVNGMTRDAVQGVKASVKDVVRRVHSQLQEKLASRLGDRAAGVEDLVQEVCEAAGDLGEQDSELKLLRSSSAYVKPVSRHLGTCPDSKEEFYAYDLPLDKQLEYILHEIWGEMKSSSQNMKHTDPRTSMEYSDDLNIADLWDGVEFQKFMIRVAPRPGEMPLVFMFYYDGLEVVNGLGAARTTHELGCFYWALLNISPDKRMNTKYVRMATVCYQRAIGVCGMDKVVAGPAGSWVEWMQKLDRGLRLKTPEGERIFRGGTAIVAADTPAAAKLMGTKQAVGPSTKAICRNCLCCQTGDAHRKPNSFLASQHGWKCFCPGRETNFTLRGAGNVQTYISHLQAVVAGTMTPASLQSWMVEQGVNTFHGALWQMPHFSMSSGCPMDMMHIWLEGVGRQNLGALCYWLHRLTPRGCNSSLHELPRLLQEVAQSTGLPKSSFPFLTASRIRLLTEGATGGVPSADCSLSGTAGQIAHVLLHIPAIFGSLVPEDKRNDTVWQMALLTCKISRLLWQRSFSTADLLNLDKSIWLHDSLILGSPYLQHLWKPKNHYVSHFPLEILRWGPPRTYWCMAFEHENQLVKHGAQGNFQNAAWDAAESKALRVALITEEAKQNRLERLLRESLTSPPPSPPDSDGEEEDPEPPPATPQGASGPTCIGDTYNRQGCMCPVCSGPHPYNVNCAVTQGLAGVWRAQGWYVGPGWVNQSLQVSQQLVRRLFS